MDRIIEILRKYALDAAFLLATAAGAVACWIYSLPIWLLILCVVLFLFSLISLLGDLGLFGRADFD